MKLKINKSLYLLIWGTISCFGMALAGDARADDVSFNKVEINYPHDECSFKASPIDFCDQKHLDAYDVALRTQSVNFNKHYIILPIKEWRDSDERSIVAIDKNTGVVYPVPIDSFTKSVGKTKKASAHPALSFSKDSNELCITGSIFVYRSSQNGRFCFQFSGDKFVGYHTTYMGHDQP